MEKCVHDELCGGCIYQGVPYEEQLKTKEEQVKGYMLENGIKAEVFEKIEGAPSLYHYRNKMDYTFGDLVKDGEMTLGMHQKGRFMSIVTVDQCQLVPEDFNRILRETLKFCRERGYTKYHKRRHEGMMRNLVLRRGENTGEILVNVVTQSDLGTVPPGMVDEGAVLYDEKMFEHGRFDEEAYVQMIESLDLDGEVCGILRTINDDWSDAVKCDELRILKGRDYYIERIMGLDFKVSAFSFFQTNVPAVERLYKEAIALVDDFAGKTVFDLFCGTGTITQSMARSAGRAVGVEIVEDAVDAARKNAALNGLENCEFIAGDVLKVLSAIKSGELLGCNAADDGLMTSNDSDDADTSEKPAGAVPVTPDVIVVDPPRAGIHPKVLPMIAEYGVDEILYISCNPKTMCKDLAVLQEYGYRVKYMKPYDNFPMTKHVECVCLLAKTSGSEV